MTAAEPLNPNLAWAWLYSGWARIWLGQPDVAIEHLAHAMRLSPLDPRAASRCRQALQTYPGMGIVPAGFFIRAVATGGDLATWELAEIFDNSDRSLGSSVFVSQHDRERSLGDHRVRRIG